ncbi:MAG: CoA transferase [Dehalococcoidia bacterium]|nr:CoA transferase [Dehalococcoidia bacterium]
MVLPLEGYLMLDLSRLVPGPMATWMLADLGMDVLKVEEMEVARAGRARDSFSPIVDDPDTEARAMAWNFVGRNKRSIPINLRSPEGQEIFHKLAAKADVIFESYRRGVVNRLGADYETVKAINPRIIYCSLSGYGAEGQYADWPGQELNAQGMSGVGALVGDPDTGEPAYLHYPLVDTYAAACVVISIQSAILARERTGEGQFIDISITEAGVSLINQASVGYLRDGYVPSRCAVTGISPIRCKDGKYLTNASTAETHFWNRFCQAIGRPQYENVFPIPFDRRAAAAVDPEIQGIIKDVKDVMLTKTRDEWMEIIPVDISVTPLLELDEALEGEYARDRGVLWEMEHPVAGKVRQISSPFRLSETPPKFRNFAPMLGENTLEVLEELGYDESSIERMEREGIVRVSRWSPPPA